MWGVGCGVLGGWGWGGGCGVGGVGHPWWVSEWGVTHGGGGGGVGGRGIRQTSRQGTCVQEGWEGEHDMQG